MSRESPQRTAPLPACPRGGPDPHLDDRSRSRSVDRTARSSAPARSRSPTSRTAAHACGRREPLAPGRRLLLELGSARRPRLRGDRPRRAGRASIPPATTRDGAYGLGLEFLGGTPDHVDAARDTFLYGEMRATAVRRLGSRRVDRARAAHGYAPALHAAPRQLQDRESSARLRVAASDPRVRYERRAQRHPRLAARADPRGRRQASASGASSASPREVYRLEIEVPELGYQRTTLLDRDALEELLATDDVRARSATRGCAGSDRTGTGGARSRTRTCTA